jgi:hypothetical protein
VRAPFRLRRTHLALDRGPAANGVGALEAVLVGPAGASRQGTLNLLDAAISEGFRSSSRTTSP